MPALSATLNIYADGADENRIVRRAAIIWRFARRKTRTTAAQRLLRANAILRATTCRASRAASAEPGADLFGFASLSTPPPTPAASHKHLSATPAATILSVNVHIAASRASTLALPSVPLAASPGSPTAGTRWVGRVAACEALALTGDLVNGRL